MFVYKYGNADNYMVFGRGFLFWFFGVFLFFGGGGRALMMDKVGNTLVFHSQQC